MFCFYCGQQLNDGAKFCKHCGNRQNVDQAVNMVGMQKPKKKKTALVLIPVIVFLVGVLAIGGYFIANKLINSDDKTEAVVSNEEASEDETIDGKLDDAESVNTATENSQPNSDETIEDANEKQADKVWLISKIYCDGELIESFDYDFNNKKVIYTSEGPRRASVFYSSYGIWGRIIPRYVLDGDFKEVEHHELAVSDSRPVFYRYEFSNDGLLKNIYIYHNGELVTSYHCLYSTENDLAGLFEYRYEDEKAILVQSNRFYSDEMRSTEVIYCDEAKNKEYESEYYFDDKFNILSYHELWYESDGSISDEWERICDNEYDSDGRIVASKTYTPDGQLQHTYTYEYDEYGNLVKATYTTGYADDSSNLSTTVFTAEYVELQN